MLTEICIDRYQMLGECFNFLAAGTELIGVPIANELYYLSQNKNALAKVKTEVKNIIASDKQMTQEEFFKNLNVEILGSMPYLRDCFNESLRINTA